MIETAMVELLKQICSYVYTAKLPKDPKLPAVCIQRYGSTPYLAHSGPVGLRNQIFLLTVYAEYYSGALTLFEAVYQLLDCYRGIAAGIEIDLITLSSEGSIYEDGPMQYRANMEVKAWYRN